MQIERPQAASRGSKSWVLQKHFEVHVETKDIIKSSECNVVANKKYIIKNKECHQIQNALDGNELGFGLKCIAW